MQTQDGYVARWGSHALKDVQHPWTKCSRVPQTLWCPNHKIPQHISNHSHPWDGITTIKSHWQRRSWGWIEEGSFKRSNYYYNSRELREEEKRVKTFCVLSSLLFFFAQRRKYYINRKESKDRGTQWTQDHERRCAPTPPHPNPTWTKTAPKLMSSSGGWAERQPELSFPKQPGLLCSLEESLRGDVQIGQEKN